MTLYQLAKQILINRLRRWFHLILLITGVVAGGMISSILYFSNLSDTPQVWFGNLFYILLFTYAPFCYLLMERLYHNQEISLLGQFALSNMRLVRYLLGKTVLWLMIPFFALLFLLLPAMLHDLAMGKAILLNLVIYHILFTFLGISIFGYGGKMIVDPKYDGVKKALSGGWTDPQLTPTLFAPGALFAVINVINVIASKTIESFFFQVYVDTIYLYIVLGIAPILLILGVQYFVTHLRKLYGILAGLNYLYHQGSYQIEAGFFEEKFPIPQLIRPLFLKDLRLLKRRFRVQIIFAWVAPFLILFAGINTNLSFKSNALMLLGIHALGVIPLINIFYSPVEGIGADHFPVKKQQFLLSKYFCGGIYFAPYWFAYIVVGIVAGVPIFLVLIALTIIQPLLAGYIKQNLVVHGIMLLPLFYYLFL